MPTYVIVNRAPTGYAGSAQAAAAWNAWFDSLGGHLADRGNPVFARRTLGDDTGTELGGYTLVTAENLDAAVVLAHNCPMLAEGGAVEVGELTLHNHGKHPAANVPNTADEEYTGRLSIDKSYVINASRHDVWQALVNPDRVSQWSGAPAQAGDRVGAQFSLWQGHLWGTITAVDPGRILEQAWHSVDMEQDEPTKVIFHLDDAADGGTVLHLRHDNIASAHNQRSFAAGWDDKYVGPLKRFVEGVRA
jgi:uncharacterized protein YndB with AHSA1/START domain